jgi:hypothetical protein
VRTIAGTLLLGLAAGSVAAPIVKHPNELQFKPLAYEAPRRDQFRHELSSGVPVYVVEDKALPLVNVMVTVRGGDYMDSPR